MGYFIIILLIIVIVQNWDYKRHNQVLNCGLFGYIGKNDVDITKIKLLGIYNETRGKHSCGISIDDQIFKGVNEKKEWGRFIEKTEIPLPVNNQIVLGHTRHATYGIHSEQNAHPFLINNRLTGVHNGSLDNHIDLAKQYNVDITGLEVDSQILYKIIEERGFDVLEDYYGYAALMFKYSNEPNSLYIYHGASCETAEKLYYVERPLFYLAVADGYYISSMENSLEAIQTKRVSDSGNIIKPHEVPLNQVIRITVEEDKVTTEVVKKVERWEKNIGAKSYKTSIAPYAVPYLKPFTPSYEYKPSPDNRKKELFLPDEAGYQQLHCIYHKGMYTAKNKLMHGVFTISNKGRILRKSAYLPSDASIYYFHKGIMILDHDAFNIMNRKIKELNKASGNAGKFARFLSCYSKYPVPVSSDNVTDVTDKTDIKWYWMGKIWPYLNFSPVLGTSETIIYAGTDVNVVENELFKHNTGAVTGQVFTRLEKDVAFENDLYSTSYFDVVYSTLRYLICSIPQELVEVIFDYVEEVILNGDKNKEEVETTILHLLNSAISRKKTIREIFEIKNLTFEEFMAYQKEERKSGNVISSTIDGEKEDDDDDWEIIKTEINNKEITVEETPIDQLLIELAESEALEAEIMAKRDMIDIDAIDIAESDITDIIEDVMCNLKSMMLAAEDAKKIEHTEAASLAVILTQSNLSLRRELAHFFSNSKRDEELIELSKTKMLN